VDAATVRKTRVAEREALLRRVVDVLREDKRVAGAWAFGSIGRGTADEWSDVDLCVVVQDEALAEAVAGRHQMVNKVGAALLEQDVPQNGPPGGAFRLAYYHGEAGLQEIDWVWRGYSGGAPPEEVRVLFGKQELRAAPPAREGAAKNADHRDPAKARALFCWAMAGVCAKYVGHADLGRAVKVLGMVTEGQQFVRERLGVRVFEGSTMVEPVGPREVLGTLRQQCLGLEELLPQLRLEEMSPAGRMGAAFVGELYAMLDLVRPQPGPLPEGEGVRSLRSSA